jgi:hypothetical protein
VWENKRCKKKTDSGFDLKLSYGKWPLNKMPSWDRMKKCVKYAKMYRDIV